MDCSYTPTIHILTYTTHQETLENTLEDTVKNAIENIFEDTIEDTSEKLAEKFAEKFTEKFSKKFAEMFAEKFAKNFAEMLAEKLAAKFAKKFTEKIAKKFAEAIDASMAGEETPQTVTMSAETGKVLEANELKDHMVKHDTKVLETQWVGLYGDDTTKELLKRSCQGQGGVAELPRHKVRRLQQAQNRQHGQGQQQEGHRQEGQPGGAPLAKRRWPSCGGQHPPPDEQGDRVDR